MKKKKLRMRRVVGGGKGVAGWHSGKQCSTKETGPSKGGGAQGGGPGKKRKIMPRETWGGEAVGGDLS